ncbi:amidohydrolase [Rhizodiscina lignyota]|uniref:Amidohydrolase n=1 Tax=Rhizodiscina lignyota TaxID=1504668 RepID=A0A9P4IC84_9PEZI|nr:amidohydrolase [Rhizodiscina lignyota]
MAESTPAKKITVVDVHSHLYPTFYFDLLKSRTVAPYVKDNKFINRASAAGAGKPIIPVLYDVQTKIKFMDLHKIDISILSIGNPWLDFLEPEGAGEVAKEVNDKFNELCAAVPNRLFFFACLPLSGSHDVILAEIKRVSSLSHVRGIVMGCNGMGEGLDDPSLIQVYRTLAENNLPIFLHPNYGLPEEVWGKRAKEYGQILPISMGFPLETTIAMTRLILSGAFQEVPELRFIVSHAGGTLPFLAGRVENAIDHDRLWHSQGKAKADRRTIWDVLKKNVYMDGIVYDKIPLKMAVEAAGSDRVMFGTDHPFFLPVDGGDEIPSMWSNERAVREGFGKESKEYQQIMGENAIKLLDIGGCGCH